MKIASRMRIPGVARRRTSGSFKRKTVAYFGQMD